HVHGGDQVFGFEFSGVVLDLGAPLIFCVGGVLGLQRQELVGNDGGDTLGARQDIKQIGNGLHDVFVFADDLVLLQTGQALQAHVQDFLRLDIAEAVQAVGLHTEYRRQAFGTVRRAPAWSFAVVGT